MKILGTKKVKKQKTILASIAFLMITSSQIHASYSLGEEDQRYLIRAHHLAPQIDGTNVKAGIIDDHFDPRSDTKNVLSACTRQAFAGKYLRQITRNAHELGHDHANHVASSTHNIAPRTELRVIDLNNEANVRNKSSGNAQIIAAIDEAIASKVDFLNISLRLSPDHYKDDKISEDMKQALLRAKAAGIGIIKSAGNDQEFTGSTDYTRSLVDLLEKMQGSMILAAATEYNPDGQHEKLASYSKGIFDLRTGKTKLDRKGKPIVARGSNLAGLAHDYTVSAPGQNNYGCGADNVRMTMSGTSMAAPIVTGAACLIKSAHPELSSRDVLDYILKSARTKSLQDNIDLPVGKYGRGIVDVENALRLAKGSK